MRIFAVALALLPVAAALAASEPVAPDWPQRTGNESPEQLAKLFPESATLLRRAIPVLVDAGRTGEARDAIARLADLGYALSPAGQAQLAALIDKPTGARFAANGTGLGSPRSVTSVPARFGLVESAVETRGMMVASSITAQDLIVSRGGKDWRALGIKGLASPGGLAVDQRRGLVWTSSARFEQTPRPEEAFIGLIAVDPLSGKVVRRIAAPKGVNPSDILLAPDGTVYASDPFVGGIWRVRPRETALVQLVSPEQLRSPQGLALSADGKRLYASDYAYGLAVIELASGQVSRLASGSPMMLDGIDGLLRHGNELIGLQNGTRPFRVIAVRLSADGSRAVSLRVLMQRLPGGGEPTTGTIRGTQLRYVANARWDLYGKGGALPEGASPGATEVHSLPLSPK